MCYFSVNKIFFCKTKQTTYPLLGDRGQFLDCKFVQKISNSPFADLICNKNCGKVGRQRMEKFDEFC